MPEQQWPENQVKQQLRSSESSLLAFLFNKQPKWLIELTDVVEVVCAVVEEPVSVAVTAEAQRCGGAVPLVDDAEQVWTLRQVVVDDHIFIWLYEHKEKRQCKQTESWFET